jgi:hypothetical protein
LTGFDSSINEITVDVLSQPGSINEDENNKLSRFMERPGVSSAPCICCLGSITNAALDALSAEIEKAVRGRTRGYAGCPTCISVITPPILDTGIFTC